MTDAQCPAPATVESLLLGLVPRDEARALEDHVAGCPRCAAALSGAAADDPLVRACRRAGEHTPTPGAVARLLPRLKRLLDPAPTSTHLPHPPPDGPATDATRVEGQSPVKRADSIEAGGPLGPFQLLDILGRGGMGVVFRARDPRLDREVALKVIRADLAARPGILERFRREAKAAAAIEDDHIVGVYEVGEDGGVPYLAMPLLRGQSLEARLRSSAGGLPLVELLRVARETAAGLAAANRRGLAHRDIKPSNLWLEAPNRRVKLLDFGLAGAVEGGAGRDVSGTPAYMAPEQARGQATDARADLFSLGVVLYQMATGALPFTGADALSVLLSVAADEPAPAEKVNPKLPRRLGSLIRALLAKRPDDRPATADAVVREIEAVERDLRPRRRWLIAAAVAAIAAVGVAGYLLRKPPAPAPTTGEVTFDVADGAGEVAVRAPDGTELPRLGLGAGRTLTLAAGHYSAAYADPGTKLRPWPGSFEVAAGRGLTVTLRPVGEVSRYAGHTGGVTAVAFLSAKDLRNVSSAGGDFKPVLWDPAAKDGPTLLPAVGATPQCLAVSPDGTRLAVGEGGKTRTEDFAVRLLKLGSGEVLHVFADHHDWVTALAFAPGGGHLLTGLRDGRLLFRDLTTGKARSLPGHTAAVRSVAVAPAAGRAATAGGKRIVVWDLATLRPVKEWAAPAEVRAAAILPDGSAVAAAGADGLLRLWSVSDRGVRTFAGHDGPVLTVAASADGNRLLSGGADGTVRLWDVAAGAEVILLRHEEKSAVSAVALAADGRHALSGGTDKTVRLWKLPE